MPARRGAAVADLDQAPVTVTGPDGTVYEPVRIVIADGSLTVSDRAGIVLASDTVVGWSGGRRITAISGGAGSWQARTLCSCSSRLRDLRRQWEEGAVT